MNTMTDTTQEVQVAPIKAPILPLEPNTVFILCGPTNSGKSTFAWDLTTLARWKGLSAETLSSDDYRARLLDSSSICTTGIPGSSKDELTKYRTSVVPQSVSRQAFELLMAELKALTSFPVNTDIIVVDTTGMGERFRNEVKAVCEANHYRTCLVMFDYKNRSDYLVRVDDDRERQVILESVLKFRKQVLPSVKVGDFDSRIKINSRRVFGRLALDPMDPARKALSEAWSGDKALTEWAKQSIALRDSTVTNFTRSTEPLLPGPTYAVIGDSHECVEELQQLIGEVKKVYPGIKIIHIGDYLDKGETLLKWSNT